MGIKVVGVFVAGAILALTGCGGGLVAKGVDYTSAKAIATALDVGGFACTEWTRNTNAIMTREAGYCTHGSADLSVSTYQDAHQMQQFNQLLKESGWASGVIVQGDQWQVNANDKEEAVAIQSILGGDIR